MINVMWLQPKKKQKVPVSKPQEKVQKRGARVKKSLLEKMEESVRGSDIYSEESDQETLGVLSDTSLPSFTLDKDEPAPAPKSKPKPKRKRTKLTVRKGASVKGKKTPEKKVKAQKPAQPDTDKVPQKKQPKRGKKSDWMTVQVRKDQWEQHFTQR